MQDKMFYKDLAFTGAKDFKSGNLGRREFLYLCALAGFATSSVIAGDAEAAANEIVLWNWGGDAVKCHTSAFGADFTKDTGLPVKYDTSGPLQGKIKEMVNSGNVTADVADADAFDAISLGKSGHLEKIDYSVVDKKKVLEGALLGITESRSSFMVTRSCTIQKNSKATHRVLGRIFSTPRSIPASDPCINGRTVRSKVP